MSQPLTSEEMRVGNLLASKCVVWPTPESPRSRACHIVSTVCPSGVIQPVPVTTTRRFMASTSQGRKTKTTTSYTVEVRESYTTYAAVILRKNDLRRQVSLRARQM